MTGVTSCVALSVSRRNRSTCTSSHQVVANRVANQRRLDLCELRTNGGSPPTGSRSIRVAWDRVEAQRLCCRCTCSGYAKIPQPPRWAARPSPLIPQTTATPKHRDIGCGDKTPAACSRLRPRIFSGNTLLRSCRIKPEVRSRITSRCYCVSIRCDCGYVSQLRLIRKGIGRSLGNSGFSA